MKSSPFIQRFCDGLLGRKSLNPYGWDKAVSLHAYNKGFQAGIEKRKDENITLTIDREEN